MAQVVMDSEKFGKSNYCMLTVIVLQMGSRYCFSNESAALLNISILWLH